MMKKKDEINSEGTEVEPVIAWKSWPNQSHFRLVTLKEM